MGAELPKVRERVVSWRAEAAPGKNAACKLTAANIRVLKTIKNLLETSRAFTCRLLFVIFIFVLLFKSKLTRTNNSICALKNQAYFMMLGSSLISARAK